MPSFVTPRRAVEWIGYVSLTSQADVKLVQANPTLAAGDVKVSTDGGAFANITTLPTVTPATGRAVKVTLSVAEMTGDNIIVVFNDAAGAEWCDLVLSLQTTARQVDELAYNIALKKNAAFTAFMFQMTDSATHLPKTGLVDGTFTIKRVSIDGAAGTAIAGTITEVDATNLPGIYKVNLLAAETNGNALSFCFAATGADTLEFSLLSNP